MSLAKVSHVISRVQWVVSKVSLLFGDLLVFNSLFLAVKFCIRGDYVVLHRLLQLVRLGLAAMFGLGSLVERLQGNVDVFRRLWFARLGFVL